MKTGRAFGSNQKATWKQLVINPMPVARTATETLVAVMEEFGVCEPKECLVIYTNQDGDLCWSSTSDSMMTKLGLIEACKQFMIARITGE